MESRWISRSILGVAVITLMLIVSPDAHASKEKFVRDKPHVNVGDAQSEELEAKDKKDKKDKNKGARKEAKQRAEEVASGTRKGEDDVAKKTNKSEAARARKPD